jgi:glycosyltransferase involved in cell wall biosynthesis
MPYPRDYAARIDVSDRVRVLQDLGLDVDVLATLRTGDLPPSDSKIIGPLVKRFYWITRSAKVIDHFHLDPYQLVSRRALSQVDLDGEYDFVILEGHYVAPVLDNPSLRARHVLLRVNNDERLYFFRLAFSQLGLTSAYYSIEAAKFCLQWPALMRRVSTWMFSSAREHARFEGFAQRVGARSILLSPHIEEFIPPHKSESHGVLFLGSLFMPNNLEAVRWYLHNIHPRLLELPGYCFEIAGNTGRANAGKNVARLLQGITAVQLTENPTTLDAIYARNAVFVNPMRKGAGIKLKTVHALANGLPVVATTTGNEGTGLREGVDLFETDDAVCFAKRVRYLLEAPRERVEMVEKAQARIRLQYRQHVTLGQVLVRLIDKES